MLLLGLKVIKELYNILGEQFSEGILTEYDGSIICECGFMNAWIDVKKIIVGEICDLSIVENYRMTHL
jgi:hypothetical protein